VLDLPAASDDTLGGAPEQVIGAELLLDGACDLVRLRQVGRREEDEA